MKGPLFVHNGSSADDEQQENANAAAKEANLWLVDLTLVVLDVRNAKKMRWSLIVKMMKTKTFILRAGSLILPRGGTFNLSFYIYQGNRKKTDYFPAMINLFIEYRIFLQSNFNETYGTDYI